MCDGKSTDNAGGICWFNDASECPGGCALEGRCGTEKECDVAGIAAVIGLSIFGGVCCLICCCACFCCAKTKHDLNENAKRIHTTSSDGDKKEPLLDNQNNAEA